MQVGIVQCLAGTGTSATKYLGVLGDVATIFYNVNCDKVRRAGSSCVNYGTGSGMVLTSVVTVTLV